MLFLTPADLL